MFDFVRKHMRLMQFALLLLIFPAFVLFGIEGYSRFGDSGGSAVATVAGQEITQAEWDAAHRQQIEQLRSRMPDLDARLFDQPMFKQQTLEQMVRERLLAVAADKLHLTTGDERLAREFKSDPRYGALRNPDGSVNRQMLQARGMTSEQFAQQLRRELTLQQVLGGVTETVLAPRTSVDSALDALAQQREIQVQRFATADYRKKIAPTDAEVAAYYHDLANAAQFAAPETASIEYLVLDLEATKKGIKIGDEELRKAYAENPQRFEAPAERRASHILVRVDKDAPADTKAAAKSKAQGLLDQLKKDPSKFADLAKKNSDDPGSAAKGGDLGAFGRGAMVKPFEEAAFALKPGELSGLVETDFGYHIIKLESAKGGEQRSFESVRGQIEDDLRTQQAKQRYAEAAEQFTNLVYEQSDSLKPAAEKLGLDVKTAQVLRTPAESASGPLGSAKFLDAVFASDTINGKRNTQAIEVGPNQLASARVIKHTPSRQLPLEAVRDRAREAIVVQRAQALARKDGEERLAALKGGADASSMPPAVTISRATMGDLAPQAVEAALKADATKLPAAVGVPLGAEGYAVVRVNKVLGRDPAAGDAAVAREQYGQAWGNAEAQAYYDALKSRFKVEIDAPAVAPLPSAVR